MKKITVLLGSPRKNGNSTILAAQLAEGAKSAGGEVRSFDLSELDIAACSGCGSCQDSPGSGCVIEDGMREVYREVTSADALVFAGPVYWFSVSAQTKIAIDRLYAVGGSSSNLLGGKKFGVILTYADEDPFVSGAANAVRMFRDMAAYVGASLEGVVHGSAFGAGEIRSSAAAMEGARELGRKLAQ
jgi:multimeric flavodoxin WrbA